MSARLKTHFIPVWKEAPFLRLLIPLIAGIVLQWYLRLSPQLLAGLILSIFAGFVLIFFSRYRANNRFGIMLYLLLAATGCLLVLLKDGRNWRSHISKHYYPNETVVAVLQEPLVEKPKTYKAIASVSLVDSAGFGRRVKGNIIMYLAKDSVKPQLTYGSTVLFTKALNPIKRAGNPGGFDYQRYAAFKNLYYQVYLASGDYTIVPGKTYNRFQELLFKLRGFVITTFRNYVGTRRESGMAEALLVGYKEDLDKSLVEQYANTGVVHIIAISGMHLGLIYGLLFFILKPLCKRRYGYLLHAAIIISALWIFSLLTGAAPSITRSAIMFTVIVCGDAFSKRSGIYNALALSAFILLLINPFNLWDVGFQLSYAAILSIAIAARPLSNLLQPANIFLKKLWQLIAVTLAAQVFTLPLVLYHFHQFPLSFLLANLVAVPLASLMLYLLILLVAFAWFPSAAGAIGFVVQLGIKFLNHYIAWIDALPYSKIGEIYYTVPQTLALIMILVALCWWLLHRHSAALLGGLSAVLTLVILKQIHHYQVVNQQKIVVYNVPKLLAIDVIQGPHYTFIGDTALFRKDFLQNFHLLPSRIFHQVALKRNLDAIGPGSKCISTSNFRVILLNRTYLVKQLPPIVADIIVINNNCRNKPAELLPGLECKVIVLDGTMTPARILQWKNAAEGLHLRLHSVQEQGAFVMDL